MSKKAMDSFPKGWPGRVGLTYIGKVAPKGFKEVPREPSDPHNQTIDKEKHDHGSNNDNG